MNSTAKLEKILYCEDEPDIQTIVQMALEMIGGFNVCICSSGKEAIAAAPDFAPQLVLLDVMMPEMDGPTTFQELKKHAGMTNIPVIFMTAKAMADEISELKKLGAADVIPKPFDPMSLPDKIREIWTQHQAQ